MITLPIILNDKYSFAHNRTTLLETHARIMQPNVPMTNAIATVTQPTLPAIHPYPLGQIIKLMEPLWEDNEDLIYITNEFAWQKDIGHLSTM